MTFSEIISKMHYWECNLCGHFIGMFKTEQKPDYGCLCMKCVTTELKAESELTESIKSSVSYPIKRSMPKIQSE